MALHLEEVPEFRCTINLVPSLLVQLDAYVHGATDRHLDVSRMPADGLSPRRRALPARQLLHGVRRRHDPAPSALPRAVPAARPRARHRPSRPCAGSASATSATCRSGPTWPGSTRCSSRRTPSWPSSRPRAGATPRTRSTGCSTSSATCSPQVIPLHRKLADRGQVELTTTPFYHPILPLLLRQAAGPRGDARRQAARTTRTATPRTPRSTSAAPSRATASTSASGPGACGRARARSARR